MCSLKKSLYHHAKDNRLLSSFLGTMKYYFNNGDADELLKRWLTKEELQNKEYVATLKKGMYFAEAYYCAEQEEYLRYGFVKLSEAGIRQYVCEKERYRIMKSRVDRESYEILRDKLKTYEHFKKFYQREMLAVNSMEDLPQFKEFLQRQRSIIVKPNRSSGGAGIFRMELKDDEVPEKLLEAILKQCKYGAILEELIIQDEGMAKFHPQSVNTVRVVTFNDGGNIEIVQTSTRIGLGNSVVDNGCLSAEIDTEHGVIVTRGRHAHERGLYAIHPETGEQILGAQIPHWEELLALAKELPKVLPKQRIIGWDIALSTKGWVMIEGNSCPMVQILAGEGHGIRPVFEKITAKPNK